MKKMSYKSMKYFYSEIFQIESIENAKSFDKCTMN